MPGEYSFHGALATETRPPCCSRFMRDANATHLNASQVQSLVAPAVEKMKQEFDAHGEWHAPPIKPLPPNPTWLQRQQHDNQVMLNERRREEINAERDLKEAISDRDARNNATSSLMEPGQLSRPTGVEGDTCAGSEASSAGSAHFGACNIYSTVASDL